MKELFESGRALLVRLGWAQPPEKPIAKYGFHEAALDQLRLNDNFKGSADHPVVGSFRKRLAEQNYSCNGSLANEIDEILKEARDDLGLPSNVPVRVHIRGEKFENPPPVIAVFFADLQRNYHGSDDNKILCFYAVGLKFEDGRYVNAGACCFTDYEQGNERAAFLQERRFLAKAYGPETIVNPEEQPGAPRPAG